jgi:type VI secretion system protein ImpE
VTPLEALAEGRLAEALSLQEGIVAALPDNPAAERLLVDLLTFAGRLDDAASHLTQIHIDDPEWRETKRTLRDLLRAEWTRSVEGSEPTMIPRTEHAVERWRAIESLRRATPEDAVAHIDRADAASPYLRGFIDGREFEGLHDTDDRFASVLEAFRDGDYLWFAWEVLRKVTLAPAVVLFEQLFRPATITLKDGVEASVHLPLIYPGSCNADGVFALGMETDHVCPDGGPMRSIGGKLLLAGEGVEVPLAECRMIEIR